MDSLFTLGGVYPAGVGTAGYKLVPPCFVGWLIAQWGASKLAPALFPASYPTLKPIVQSAFADRLISTVHATVLAVQVWRVLLSGAHPLVDPTGAPSAADAPMVREWQACIQWSQAYYLFDLLRMLFNKHVAGIGLDGDFVQNAIHHGVMFVGYMPVLTCRSQIALSAFGLLGEMSTPVLNARWIMVKCGLQRTTAFQRVTMALAALFFVFRIAVFPTAFVLCARGAMPWPGKGVHLLLWLLNCAGNTMWFKALLRSIAKGRRREREAEKAGDEGTNKADPEKEE